MTQTRRSQPVVALGVLALVLLAASFWVSLTLAPPDRLMGEVQRIMYVHVPAAWVGFLAFFTCFVASILYLWRRDLRWDALAHSSAELGVVFLGLATALGSIWGKPTWGVWWTWDPRLTTAAILLAIFLGYLALRAFVEEPDRRARRSAAVGIVGFLDVPIVYLSVFWWRTLHQQPLGPETVATPMRIALLLGVVSFTVFFAFLLAERYRLARLESGIELAEVSRA
ncbi:MAG: cytochrome C assembly protein [Gemmatimonadetes bacterium]|nr:cytochrome C assembly protein [Gemmatimonadota bacterium]NIR78432.1 cytochrome C assembly protein [Gemmatimonadota bacterium]NIT87044.1 cytochrome C assembly protein [Gemmatimonadota bacterium]NIU30882.1 cytochrome C assembly protein [Gemmatimonadota bacterium]NIU35648.1 cytochrome C assembly protein [Gemmatimonadota bacterium]